MKYHVEIHFENMLMQDGSVSKLSHSKNVTVEARSKQEAISKAKSILFYDKRLKGSVINVKEQA